MHPSSLFNVFSLGLVGFLASFFEKTDKGMKATVEGKTPLAIKVAQNHAEVVSAFAAHGWSEHDKTHPAVAK